MSVDRRTILGALTVAPLALVPAAVRAAAGDARLVVFYNAPKDAAAFDAYYFGTHAPLVKKIPGLRSYIVSAGSVATPGASPAPYHMVAELAFDSMDALNAGLGSPEGKAAVADIPNFAQAGTQITIFSTRNA